MSSSCVSEVRNNHLTITNLWLWSTTTANGSHFIIDAGPASRTTSLAIDSYSHLNHAGAAVNHTPPYDGHLDSSDIVLLSVLGTVRDDRAPLNDIISAAKEVAPEDWQPTTELVRGLCRRSDEDKSVAACVPSRTGSDFRA